MIVPLLKWAGGKRQLRSELMRRLPERWGTYYEPFIGGGALLVELAKARHGFKPSEKPAEEAVKSGKGKYRISFDRFLTGSINGGGPEITFNTFNGDIYIRKGK